MHICQEGAESNNILPQTRDVGLQGANVASNVVGDGVSHSGANPVTTSAVVAWAAAVAARAAMVVATSASFLAVAALTRCQS